MLRLENSGSKSADFYQAAGLCLPLLAERPIISILLSKAKVSLQINNAKTWSIILIIRQKRKHNAK